jgi:hypothetical protein
MARERREFMRRSGLRDAKLFVIASEGAVTEPKYFNDLKERWHNPRIHIEVVVRDNPGLSSPEHVLGELDRFRREYHLHEGDQLWLVMDRDPQSWTNETLRVVARECQRRRYSLAVSNPCFEIWLLLHFEDVPNQGAARRQELIRNAKRLLKSEVARHCSTSGPHIDNFIPHTEKAIARAEALDTSPRARWPSQLGTRVYRLVKQLVPASS